MLMTKHSAGKVQYRKDMTVVTFGVDEVEAPEKQPSTFIGKLRRDYEAAKLRAQMRGRMPTSQRVESPRAHLCNFWKLGLKRDFGGRVLIKRTCADIPAQHNTPAFKGCQKFTSIDILPEAQARAYFKKLRNA